MKEIWKDIKGYEGLYQVSNLGRIKSLKRKVRYQNSFKTLKERIKGTFIGKQGYLRVELSKNGVNKIWIQNFILIYFLQMVADWADIIVWISGQKMVS